MRSDQFAVIKHFVLAAETDFFFFLTEEIRAVLEETLMVNSVREDSVVLKRTTFFFFKVFCTSKLPFWMKKILPFSEPASDPPYWPVLGSPKKKSKVIGF